MPKQMTAEQVLKVIYEVRADAFADSRRLSALFADYSGGRLKAQQNQLDIFLKCDGNTCILNLRNAPKQKQQTEYHRLIQEMVSNYGMQEEVALKVSGAFWRVVIGTEPPVAKPAPIPEAVPVSASASKETAVRSSKVSDSAATPKSEQNPVPQTSISDNHPIQKSSPKPKIKLEIPRKKWNKRALGELMSGVSIGVVVAWAISMLLAGVSCGVLMDMDKTPGIAAQPFLLVLLVLAEGYVFAYREKWIKKHLRITIILEIIILVAVLSISIPYANAVDTELAAFMEIAAVLWQILTIVVQILLN